MHISATITRPDGQTTNLAFAHNLTYLEEIDGVGNGSVTIPKATAPQAGLGEFLYVSNRIDILVDGAVKGSFLLEEMSIAIVDEEETITLSGPGYPAVLGEAVVYPGDPSNPSLDDPETRTLSGTPGAIMRTLVLEAQARGALADITFGFTNSTDSYSTAWPDSIEVEVKEGNTYHQVFRRLQELGHSDFWFEGTELNAAPVRGVDRTATVRIQPGRDVGLSRYTGEGPLRNATLFRWGAGLDEVTYPTAGLHRRSESYLNLRDARDAASAVTALTRHHGTYGNQADSFTLELVPGEWPVWWVGDTIKIQNQFGWYQDLVVSAVSVQQQPDGELLIVPTVGIERPPLEAGGLVSDDWEPTAPGARPATLVVAASDSSEAGRAGADLVCTGTDDQDTINAGILALHDAGGGSLLLLEGTYTISGSIVMHPNVHVRGQGEATVLQSTVNTFTTWDPPGLAGAGDNIIGSICDLRISGGGTAISGLWDASRFEGLYIDGCAAGISTSSGGSYGGDFRVSVIGCHFSSITGTAVRAVYGAHVTGNRFNACGLAVEMRRHGSVIGNHVASCTRGIRAEVGYISGNVITGTTESAVWVWGDKGAIVNNLIAGGGGDGLYDAIRVAPNGGENPDGYVIAQNVVMRSFGPRTGFSSYAPQYAWQYRYGISVESGASNTRVIHNRIMSDAYTTGAILDAGTATEIVTGDSSTVASAVGFTPAGWITDTDVQAAIESLISRTLDSIDDVDAAAPSDGDVLTFDSATSTWTPAPTASVPATLDDLTDVFASAPSDGDSLTWDAATSSWVPSAVSGGGGGASTLDDLTDVDATTPSDGQALVWNATTSAWEATTLGAGSGPIALDDLTDASISTPSDGDVLTYDSSTSLWIPSAPSGGGGGSPWGSLEVTTTPGASPTVDVTGVGAIDITLDSDATLALTGSAATYQTIDLIVRQGATGYTLSMPGSVVGTKTFAAGKYRWAVARMVTTDGGTTWFCTQLQTLLDPSAPILETLSGLRVHMDASVTASITESGGAVTAWENLAPFDANSDGNPDLATGTATLGTTMNGLQTIAFNGINNRLALPANTMNAIGATWPRDLHMFAAVRITDVTDDGALFSTGRRATQDARSLFTRPTGKVAYIQYAADVSTADGVLANGETCILEMEVTVGGTYSIRKNGVELLTGAPVVPNQSALFTDIGSFGTQYYWEGELGELIALDAAQTADDADAVRLYLASKWGITL